MKINSITRTKEYASWQVVFEHDGKQYDVIIKLNDNNLLETNSTIPSVAVDLIRNELAYENEIVRMFCGMAMCRTSKANW